MRPLQVKNAHPIGLCQFEYPKNRLDIAVLDGQVSALKHLIRLVIEVIRRYPYILRIAAVDLPRRIVPGEMKCVFSPRFAPSSLHCTFLQPGCSRHLRRASPSQTPVSHSKQ